MANRRREWLLEQVMAGTVKAATLPELRLADDDFCAGGDVGDYCRRVVVMSSNEPQAGAGTSRRADLTAATAYLGRVLELESRLRRSPD